MDDKKTDISTHNVPRPSPDEIIGKNAENLKNLLRIEIIKKTYG